MDSLAYPTPTAPTPTAPVVANSPLFHDTDAATLAWLREASLLTLADPPLGVDRDAVAGMLADANHELADRAMLLIQLDPWEFDVAHLVRENERLRRALAERDRLLAAGPRSGRRIVTVFPKGADRAE